MRLKQFVGLTWLTLTHMFYDRSSPLGNDDGSGCNIIIVAVLSAADVKGSFSQPSEPAVAYKRRL